MCFDFHLQNICLTSRLTTNPLLQNTQIKKMRLDPTFMSFIKWTTQASLPTVYFIPSSTESSLQQSAIHVSKTTDQLYAFTYTKCLIRSEFELEFDCYIRNVFGRHKSF